MQPPFSGRLPDFQKGAELTAGSGALWSGVLLPGGDLHLFSQRKECIPHFKHNMCKRKKNLAVFLKVIFLFFIYLFIYFGSRLFFLFFLLFFF